MSEGNFTVARVVQHTQAAVGKFERHIERKNENYENMNVNLSRTSMNVHFKDTGGQTYNAWLDRQASEGKVSLRGLKKDAKVFDEMIFDVNSAYFEDHGGYEYAVRFYAEAFRFAEREYGPENIVSAVLHADERNTWLSDVLDKPVYHYHLHVMAIPVVEKEVRWSKRCKDPDKVGKVKEVIRQVSHSKKWASQKVTDETGHTQIVKSYSLLQDRFFEHMRDAGFEDFQRGERGSTKEHLEVLDYKIQQDKEHLAEIQERISTAQEKLDDVEPVAMQMVELESIGKKSFTGKVQMSPEDYGRLTELAKEGIASRGQIARLNDTIRSLNNRIWNLNEAINRLERRLDELTERCKPYLEAVRKAPQRVKRFLDELLHPRVKAEDEPLPWDASRRDMNVRNDDWRDYR